MKRPRIGDMKYRVAISRPTRADDGVGGGVESFTTLTTVWAAVEIRRAYSVAEGSRAPFRTEYVIRTRYMDGIQEGDTATVNGKRLTITGTNGDKYAGFMEIYAEER